MAKFNISFIPNEIEFALSNRNEVVDFSNHNNGNLWLMNMPENLFKNLLNGDIYYSAFCTVYDIEQIVSYLKNSSEHILRYISYLHPNTLYFIRYDNGYYHIREKKIQWGEWD